MNEENDKNISRDLKREILSDLAPITPVIYGVVEAAQSVVPECVDLINKRCGKDTQNTEKIQSWLYPPLMRAIMQLLLNRKNIKTQAIREYKGYDLNADWERIILSNNGLSGSYANHSYRLLKALKAETIEKKLPPPGQSRKKVGFYCNSHFLEPQMPLFDPKEGFILQKHNVIYLWDNPIGNSPLLYIACSKWGRENRVDAYFIEPIEHPVLSIEPHIEVGEIVEAIELKKIERDLIVPLESEEKNESNADNNSREQN